MIMPTPTPHAQRNKEGILDFKRFSDKHNIKLVVVLVPSIEVFINTRLYEEVREFLKKNEIDHLDLTVKFRDLKISSKRLNWKNDGHFNPSGNQIIADILIEEYSHLFLAR